MEKIIVAQLGQGPSASAETPSYPVCCGRCSEQLATIGCVWGDGARPEDWRVQFAPAWASKDGVWQLIGQALRKRRRAERNAKRGPLDEREKARIYLTERTYEAWSRPTTTRPAPWLSPDGTLGAEKVRLHLGQSALLPCFVRCPHCEGEGRRGGVNRLGVSLIDEARERFAGGGVARHVS